MMDRTEFDGELAKIDADLNDKLEVCRVRMAELEGLREKLDEDDERHKIKLAKDRQKAIEHYVDERQRLTDELKVERKKIAKLKRRLDIVEPRKPKPEEAEA